MKRRQFLCGTLSATVALAGCVTSNSGSTDSRSGSSSSSAPTRTRLTPDGYWRTVSLEAQDTVPDRHQATLTATVEQRWITANRTARLPVTLTNTASKTRTFYGLNESELKQRWFDEFSDKGAGIGSVTRPPKCIDTDGKEPGPFGESGSAWVEELHPEESVTIVFGVVDDSRKEGCISPGTYRFYWEIPHNSSGPPIGTNPSTIQWGITLRIRGPE